MAKKEEKKKETTKVKFPLYAQAASIGILLLLILSVAFFGFVIPRTSDYQERQNSATLERSASQAGQMVSLVLDEIIHDSYALTEDPALLDSNLTLEEKEMVLQDYSRLFNVYDDIILLDPEGTVLAAANYGFRTEWKDSSFFTEAAAGNSVFSSVQIIPRPQKTVVNYLTPVFNEAGEVMNVLIFQVDMSSIWQFSDVITIGDTGFVYLEDQYERIIAGTSEDKLLESTEQFKQSDQYIFISVPIKEEHAHISSIEWEITAIQDKEEFYFGSNFISASTIGILLIASLIMIFTASFVVSIKVRTMRKFSAAMKELESGNMDTELSVKSMDEFAVMADVFNELVQSLRSTRGNLSLLFENAPLGILTIDKDGKIITVNSKMSELLGVESRLALINKNIFDVHSFTESGLNKFIEQGLEGNNIEVELQFEPLDGTEIQWHHYRGVPLVTEQDGKYERSLMLMASDVTERVTLNKERDRILEELEEKVNERTKAIEDKEEYYRSIIDNTATAMCIVEVDSIISMANQKFAELTGFSKEEIEGKVKWTQFVDKKYLQKMKEYHIARRQGKKNLVPPTSYEFEFTNKKGVTKIARMDISLIPGTKKSVASIIDVTDKVKAFQDTKAAIGRFEQIAETANEWIWEISKNGIFTYSNGAVEKILGYKPEELVGKKYFYELFVPEDREKIKKMALEILKKQGSFDHFENINLHKDGHKVYLVTSGEPILDDHGVLLGYRGVDYDQTEAVKAIDSLKKERDKLERVLGVAGSIIVSLDKEGKILMINQTGVKLLGHQNSKEVIGQNWFTNFIPERLQEEMFKVHKDVFSGVNVKETVYENPILTKSGEERIITWTNHLVTENDQVECTISSGIDITERVQAEQQMNEVLSQFSAVAQYTDDCMKVVRSNGTIILVNPATAKNHGLKNVQEAIGKKYLDLFNPINKKKNQESFERALKGESVSEEFQVPQANGDLKYVLRSFSPIKNGGDKIKKVFIVCRNVTSIKETENKLKKTLERLEEMDQMKDEFINVAAHELKTPLVPIRLQAELLLEGEYGQLGPKQTEAVAMVKKGEERLRNLIDDFLTMTKVNSGRVKITKTNLSLGKSVAETIKNNESEIKNKKISIDNKILSKYKVKADPVLLGKIVEELMDNAIKFSSRGGKIIVSATETKDSVKLKISDQGIGMTKEEMMNLYTPFYQASAGTARKYEGTGLGLAIVKGLIEVQGGEIEITSPGRNKGTTVLIIIPK